MSTDWMQDGACHGMDAATFFASDSAGVAAAQQICMGCAIRAVCLEYAMTHRIVHGVWGGTSERQRARLRLERRRQVSQPA